MSRIVLATDLRCHVVIFTLTGLQRDQLKELEATLDRLSLPAGEPNPTCVKGYATAETVLWKVDPVPVAPQFLQIPVRITIGKDGNAKRVHVIHAFPQQRRSIEDVLGQWRFKPYQLDGRPAEVETGLVFQFKPGNPYRSR